MSPAGVASQLPATRAPQDPPIPPPGRDLEQLPPLRRRLARGLGAATLAAMFGVGALYLSPSTAWAGPVSPEPSPRRAAAEQPVDPPAPPGDRAPTGTAFGAVGPVRVDDFASWADALPFVAHPEPAYHYAVEVYRAVAGAALRAPGVITPALLGRSGEHRPIWAFSVRDPARPVDRRLLLIANIHALEWVPTEDALAFLLDYAAHPTPGVEVVVVPIVNPDGRARVEADLLAGRNTYRRGNAAHVDLNRDWYVNRDSPAIWKAILPGRYATSPSPTSQPETVAIDQLLCPDGAARLATRARDVPYDARNPRPRSAAHDCYPGAGEYGPVRFSAFLSLHSFGGFIYYPWAGLWRRPEVRPDDWGRYQALGEAMQAAMGAHAYRPRQLSRWGFFFRGCGMEIDHVYGQYGIPALLVETTRSGIARPSDLDSYFRWYNPRDPSRHIRAGVDMLRAWVSATADWSTINNP